MGEIQEAAQVFVVAIQGVEVAFKIGKELVDFSLEVAKKLIKFLDAMIRHEKLYGKTNIKTMLKNGDDMEVCQVPQEKLPQFKKLAKKYGILYSVVPGEKNGMADILFRADDMPRMNMLFEKMGLGEVKAKSVTDYVKDMPEEEIERIAPEEIEVIEPEIKKSVRPEKTPAIETKKVTLDDDTMAKMKQAYQDLSDLKEEFQKNPDAASREKLNQAAMNIQKKVLASHPSYEEISIATKNKNGTPLLVDQTENRIKVRIPYEMNKFIWLDKTEAFISEDRKNIMAFLKRDRTYIIVDGKNWEVEKIQGGRLYQEHYDPVHKKRTVNKAKNKNKTKEKTKKKDVTQKKEKPMKGKPTGR